MTTEPRSLSLYQEKLEELFAASPTLQTAVNKSFEAVRADHVLDDYGWYQDPANGTILHDMRPLIVIAEDDYGFHTDTLTAELGIGVVYSGSFLVLVTANSGYAGSRDMQTHKQSKREFSDFVGNVISDVETASGQNDNLILAEMKMVMAANRTPVQRRTEYNDFWETGFSFSFGTVP